MQISDKINWIISKRAKPILFKITSNQSIYHEKSNDVKFCFGVDLLNMMASAVRSECLAGDYQVDLTWKKYQVGSFYRYRLIPQLKHYNLNYNLKIAVRYFSGMKGCVTLKLFIALVRQYPFGKIPSIMISVCAQSILVIV